MAYRFDPEFADLVSSLPPTDLSDPVAGREAMAGWLSALSADANTSEVRIEDRTVPAKDDQPAVPVRTYTPEANNAPAPALLWIHGGGFVMGNVDMDQAGCAATARLLGVVIVSVEYRLAPENPWPAGLDDCYHALLWLHENAAELGIDKARVGLFGQSAGGGLSASLALKARDEEGPALCFQFLGIPELDDRLQTPSMVQYTDTPLWSRPAAELSWQYYLEPRFKPGAPDVPYLASPSRASATQLKGLPPAYISAMEFDPLRDEAILYGMKLMEAGVPVELHVYPGTFHGSEIFRHAAVSVRQGIDSMEALARGLGVKDFSLS